MKNNIKTVRENEGLTQKDCVEKFGVTLRAWQSYEQGVSEPRYELLCRIADEFKVSIDYLLGRKESGGTIIIDGSVMSTSEFNEKFDKLPPEVQQSVKQLMEYLLATAAERGQITDISDMQEKIEYITKKYSCLLTSAGVGEWLDDENIEEREFPATPEVIAADIIIPVKGDSMEPEISDGDKLCVKLCDDIEVGEIGVFILNGNGYVKKRRDGYWESVNPEYDDIYVSKTDTYKFVGRVIGKAELPE